MIITLIATAKLNAVDPQAWLADVLAPSPTHRRTDSRPPAVELAAQRNHPTEPAGLRFPHSRGDHTELRIGGEVPHPALTPGCDYLETIWTTAPDIHPFGFGHAKGGPRLACATVLPDDGPYCEAREAQLVAIGGRNYEPGYRDVFVLDKEIFFTGTEGKMTSLRSGSPNLLLEIGSAGVRIANGPQPRPFDAARERYHTYREALGLDDDGWRGPEVPPSRTTFVFETILHDATLLENKTHEPIATFELRPALRRMWLAYLASHARRAKPIRIGNIKLPRPHRFWCFPPSDDSRCGLWGRFRTA